MFDLRIILWLIISSIFLFLAYYGRGTDKEIKEELDNLENFYNNEGEFIGKRDFTGLSSIKLLGHSIIKVSNLGIVGSIVSFVAALLSIFS